MCKYYPEHWAVYKELQERSQKERVPIFEERGRNESEERKKERVCFFSVTFALESKQYKKSVEMHVFSDKRARSAEITSAPRLPIPPGARVCQRKLAFPQTSYIALTLVQSNLVYVNLDNVKNLDYVNFFNWRDLLFSNKPGFLQLFLRPNLDYVNILSLLDYFLLIFLVRNERISG